MKTLLTITCFFILEIKAEAQTYNFVWDSIGVQTNSSSNDGNQRIFAFDGGDIFITSQYNADIKHHTPNGWVTIHTCQTCQAGQSSVFSIIKDILHGYYYVGGYFLDIDGVAAINLVKIDIATGAVSPLGDPVFSINGTGPSGSIYCMKQIGNVLYVGGHFAFATQNGDTTRDAARLVITTGHWLKWGNFLHNPLCFTSAVWDIREYQGDMYIAGNLFPDSTIFYTPGLGKPWAKGDDILNTWDFSQIGTNVGPGYVLEEYQNNLIVAGLTYDSTIAFTGSNILAVNSVGVSVLAHVQGNANSVWGLAVHNPSGSLFASGTFSSVGGIPANNIAWLRNNAWQALGTGLTVGIQSISAYGFKMQTMGDTINVCGTYLNSGSPTFSTPMTSRLILTAVTGVGENETGLNSMSVYPNPTSGELAILVGESTEAVFTDAGGRIIKAEKLHVGTNNFLLNFPRGIYFIQAGELKRKIIIIN